MLNRLSIRFRLNAALTLLALLLAMTGTIGVVGMRASDANINDIYTNQLVSTSLVGKAQLNAAIVRTTLDRAVFHPDAADVPAIIDKAAGYRTKSDDAWKAYKALPMNADEARLAAEMEAKRNALFSDGIEPLMAALRAHDVAAADTVVMKTIPPLSVALTVAADALDRSQAEQAKAAYEGAAARSHAFLMLIIGAIVVGIAAALGCAFGLHRAISVPLSNMLGHFSAISHGNLTERITVTSKDEMGALMQGLIDMQRGLIRTIVTMRGGSESIASATKQIAAGNMDLSQRTEEQASSLEETASSMEELTSIVKQNADNARQASQLAGNASDIAVKGGEVVGRVIETMSGINDSSKKIADIIGVIEGIAFQTNILALNAAVEAARAGEQGRGFAVVAGEVRSLAQRSATAAKEIKELISDSVGRVENGSMLVTEAGTVIDEVVVAVKRVTDIMGEISSASDEQSAGIEQVNQAVTQMDEVTQQNAALVEEAAAAAQSLEEQAGVLRETVASFRLPAAGAHAEPVLAPVAAKAMPAASTISTTSAASSPVAKPAARKPAVPTARAARKRLAAPVKPAVVQTPNAKAAPAVAAEPRTGKLALAAVSNDADDWEQF
ncbi:methyl-accepting chemotaxis protein [Ralstonia sp. SET104]|uniref:methyl-accepting chemotaxis protein n=1 Tax=Ralstonia sp. SET104 TaxID=2448774 RepID=UPI000F58C9DD|nr:methyl-accepting chemotaxis protein [Ralstonia sp. SET104]GCB06455.1 methyl-accepting chemotaxis protein [Ralstonia sp. SET104]